MGHILAQDVDEPVTDRHFQGDLTRLFPGDTQAVPLYRDADTLEQDLETANKGTPVEDADGSPAEQDSALPPEGSVAPAPAVESGPTTAESPAALPYLGTARFDVTSAADLDPHGSRSLRDLTEGEISPFPSLLESSGSRPYAAHLDSVLSGQASGTHGTPVSQGPQVAPDGELPSDSAPFSLNSDNLAAYVLSGDKWFTSPNVIAGSPTLVTWSLVPHNTPFIAELQAPSNAEGLETFLYSGFLNEVYAAFDAWESVANIKFIQVEDGGGTVGEDILADIRLMGLFDEPHGILAAAAFPVAGDPLSGDIIFDSAEGAFWTPHNFSVVLTHEIGHAIGLDHVTGVTALMNPVFDATLTGPLADDVAGAQAIYGTPDADKPLRYSLWNDITDFHVVDQVGLGANLTIEGNSSNNTITGSAFSETLLGGGGNDTLRGEGGTDTLVGDAGDDTLEGGPGNDTLDGWDGVDTLAGGPGDDIYLITRDANDTIIEYAGEGTDIVFSSLDFALPDHVENLTLTGSSDVFAVGHWRDNVLIGNSGNNILDGGDGIDVLDGGDGFDTAYYYWSPSGVSASLATNTTPDDGWSGSDTLISIENLYGSLFDDILAGDAGPNELFGDAGNDILSGGDGNDTIFGMAGADNLDGGTGNDLANYRDSPSGVHVRMFNNANSGGHAHGDVLINIENIMGSDFNDYIDGDAGDNTIYGGAGNDILFAYFGNDFILGGMGDDYLGGQWGDDLVMGELGNDTLFGHDGNDILMGNQGSDDIDGGSGSDTADYSYSLEAVDIDLLNNAHFGGDAEGDSLINIENVTGSSYADTIRGDTQDNVLSGGSGWDTLDGRSGSDTAGYSASNGGVTIRMFNSTLSGGDAQGDTLISIENITGSAFNDYIDGDFGANTLIGGAGDDILFAYFGDDTVLGGVGNDYLGGQWGNDTVMGEDGDDTLFGHDGDDILAGGAGADAIDGGSGTDTADYGASAGGVTVRMFNNTLSGGDAQGDSLAGIENITGSAFNDYIDGDFGANTLIGGAGDDILYGYFGDDLIQGGAGNDNLGGQWGNDRVEGGAGNDLLFGHDGNDTLIGGAGADSIDGGAGTDTADYGSSAAGVNVRMFNNTLSGGDAQGDSLTGIENVTGSAFNDYIDGSIGANTLIGGAGDDVLFAYFGDDVVLGGTGNDYLGGQWGDDTITGGTGNDTMFGHDGNDTFVFDAGDGDDIIADFTAGLSAEDVLDYSSQGILFTDLSIVQSGADTIITNTISGDTVTLAGVTATDLNQGTDFIL